MSAAKEPKPDPWPVSRLRWAAYLEREVELAMANIRLCGVSTLSSVDTVEEAKRRMGL